MIKSHPVWVRGLKHKGYEEGKWVLKGRTPCGCVD